MVSDKILLLLIYLYIKLPGNFKYIFNTKTEKNGLPHLKAHVWWGSIPQIFQQQPCSLVLTIDIFHEEINQDLV